MEIMTMATAMGIVNELVEKWISFPGYQSSTYMCDTMIIETLAMLADGNCEVYVAFVGDDGYRVTTSYVIAEKDARKLFRIERSIGFDLHELPC